MYKLIIRKIQRKSIIGKTRTNLGNLWPFDPLSTSSDKVLNFRFNIKIKIENERYFIIVNPVIHGVIHLVVESYQCIWIFWIFFNNLRKSHRSYFKVFLFIKMILWFKLWSELFEYWDRFNGSVRPTEWWPILSIYSQNWVTYQPMRRLRRWNFLLIILWYLL